jgi:hypothetical protein
MSIKQVGPSEFIQSEFGSVFIRFHNGTVEFDTETEKKTFSGCSRIEFVGLQSFEWMPLVCCQARPEVAIQILEHFSNILCCWSVGEIYSLQAYFGGEVRVDEYITILETNNFQVQSVEWTLLKRLDRKGRTYECLDLNRLLNGTFIKGYEMTWEQSLEKTWQIATVVCDRWINFFGTKIPGYFYFEVETPIKKVQVAPPVLKLKK